MLEIVISPKEFYNEETNKFTYYPQTPVTLTLEHSLLSITKWEAKWHKPFLNSNGKLNEVEILDYIHFMCVKPSPENVDKRIILALDEENVSAVKEYIENPMTATFFSEKSNKKVHGKGADRVVTNELIYYWMTAYQIPFSCEKWHINRLLTLIRVCNEETEAQNNPDKKKMSQSELYARNKMLNAQRRAKLNSKG